MKRNPFLKAEKAVIKKVYGNRATLRLTSIEKVYDEKNGRITEIPRQSEYTIFISNPHEINEAVVDGKYYLKGDLHVTVAYLELIEKTSAFGRDDDVITGGIVPETDYLVFNKREYRIIKASPKNFFADTPSKIKLQLRAV